MRSRGKAWRRRAGYIAVPLVVGLSSLLLTGAAVAFSSTTSNASNSFSAGTLNLTDNDTVAANATISGLVPGSTGSRCFAVTSAGTLASNVRLYDTLGSDTNSLASSISITITQGTGTNAQCSDFVASGATLYSGLLSDMGTASSFASGLGTWAPTGTATESRDFKVAYTLLSTAPSTTQNSSAPFTLFWEAQNQ